MLVQTNGFVTPLKTYPVEEMKAQRISVWNKKVQTDHIITLSTHQEMTRPDENNS